MLPDHAMNAIVRITTATMHSSSALPRCAVLRNNALIRSFAAGAFAESRIIIHRTTGWEIQWPRRKSDCAHTGCLAQFESDHMASYAADHNFARLGAGAAFHRNLRPLGKWMPRYARGPHRVHAQVPARRSADRSDDSQVDEEHPDAKVISPPCRHIARVGAGSMQ